MEDKLYHFMNWPVIESIIYAEENQPQKILGVHKIGMNMVFQTFQPGAEKVALLLPEENKMFPMEMADEAGFFAAYLPYKPLTGYQFEVTFSDHTKAVLDDPYRFTPAITKEDITKFHAGIHETLYEKLGAHFMTMDGVEGCQFAVWAPAAMRVSVVGDFNQWDGRVHQMIRLDSGVFALFIPGVKPNALYKFEIKAANGKLLMKADPFSFCQETKGTASVTTPASKYVWHDQAWLDGRASLKNQERPVSIYECFLGSFQKPRDGRAYLNYREYADSLVKYISRMGYTHIQFMPLMEYRKEESLGYQTFSFFAPTNRYGSADDLKYLIDALHRAEIGVFMDFVPGYFPLQEDGLTDFDGSPLYECKDQRRRWYNKVGALMFDFTSREVRNFISSAALFWLQNFHLDGLRMIDLASVLYLDYGCEDGVYISNLYGDNVNLEAVEFLKHLNAVANKCNPGICMIADETTGWPGITSKAGEDGLGFDWKWNCGWKENYLRYIAFDPFFRSYHQNDLTDDLAYAYSDQYILALSHNEVEHGNPSLFGRMPGKTQEKFANLRLTYGFMMMHPGKKLIFMGQDLAEPDSWSENREIEWYLEACENNHKLQKMVADLNKLYREHPALYQLDHDCEGFAWVDCVHTQECSISFMRKAKPGTDNEGEMLLVFCNFANVMKIASIGVPFEGKYKEVFNSDAEQYGGAGFVNPRAKKTAAKGMDGQPFSMKMNIAPLSICVFQYSRE